MADVGRTLEALCRAKGLSSPRVAEDAGVSPQTVRSAWDSSSWVMRPAVCAKVLDAIGVSFDRFCTMVAMDYVADEDSVVRLKIAESIRAMSSDDLLSVYTFLHQLKRGREPIGDLPAPDRIVTPELHAPKKSQSARRRIS